METGDRTRSENVTYQTDNPAADFFRWIGGVFNAPEKNLRDRDPWPAPRDDYTGPDTTQLRSHLGRMDEANLRASAEEIRNLYNLRNNPETFDGYLHDLDSRGIGLSYEPIKDGPVFVLRTHERDFFGNEVPQDTLAASRRLVEQREAQTEAVLRENNSTGPSLGEALETQQANTQASLPGSLGPSRR